MNLKYCKFIFFITFGVSFYFRDRVDAGGPMFECMNYEATFNTLFDNYNDTMFGYLDEAKAAIEAYQTANSSQSADTYKRGIKLLSDNAMSKMSEATFDLFERISALIPGYSSETIADYAFSTENPDYPLSCLRDLRDVFLTFVLIDGSLDERVDAALAYK